MIQTALVSALRLASKLQELFLRSFSPKQIIAVLIWAATGERIPHRNLAFMYVLV
jgi:hypothetical protein